MSYESEESWGILRQLITEKITTTYLIVQFGAGAVLPLLLLGTAELARLGHRVTILEALHVAGENRVQGALAKEPNEHFHAPHVPLVS